MIAQLEPIFLWPQAHQFLHNQELNLAQTCFLVVQNMNLHTLAQLALEGTVVWLVVYWTELQSWQLQCVHRLCQSVCTNPWSAHHLKWQGIAHANANIAELAKDTCHRVEHRGLSMWHVWRSNYPLQTSLIPCHIALPAFHFHHSQFALVLIIGCVQVQCQLTWSLTIQVWNLKLTHKRNIAIFHQASFYFLAAEWVRTVQYDQLFAVLNTCLHQHTHRGNVCVTTTTIVLNIIHHYIDLVHHLFVGLFGFAVERVHLQPCLLIHFVVHHVACVHIATYTMLWTIKCNQIDILCFPKNINSGLQITIHTCWVSG